MEKHVVPHDLTLELAKKATQRAWEAYSQKYADYKPQLTWVTDLRADAQFTVKGVTVRGAIELATRGVEIELDVPFIFRPFRKKTIEVVDEEIREWIAKAKAGEI